MAMLFWATAALAAFAPGLVFGARAYRMPRVLKLQCGKCGWREDVYLPRSRYRRVDRADAGGVE